jgi:hypothetical protein
MLYPKAVEEGDYPSRNSNISPEDFNVTDINMTYSVKYIKKLLKKSLTLSVEESSNWPDGFEKTFIDAVWKIWNTGEGYPESVYSKTQLFLPQNK